MAFIAPLRGVFFNVDKVGSLDDVVTPPYDVISENAVESYTVKNPYSMIRLDITKNPGPASESNSRYQDVAGLFHQWLDQGVLLRDHQPALYFYTVQYKHPSGKMLTRKGVVAQVGLSEFGEGVVKPHEETFASVISDRLRLLDTTKAQFSKIFSLYSDAENRVLDLLEGAKEKEAMGQITDGDGCVHTLYRVTNGAVIMQVQDFFKDKSLYIADGHHRYTTALAYRRLQRERKQDFSEKDPANHIMMYLCPMEDPGLSILPTHRLLSVPGSLSMDELRVRLEPWFILEEIRGGSREVLLAEVLARMDEEERSASEKICTLFGVYHPGEDRCFLLTMKPEARDLMTGKPDQLKELDVVVLSDVIINHALQLDYHRCEEENLIHYFSDPDEAMDVAVKECNRTDEVTPLLFVMNATRIKQVKKVADEKLIMPHKSTYFYPKIMTGLLFNMQVEGEQVE
ncbi:MAG: DUF1015 domain-containing protein [Proteobacteria bacterium]|nr:DUF1015 domain-containing protein [Pseudomonadota bacterium]MBU1059264.1 DUF1015 domain-containing protein [Pseudomonadota bacterium]